MRRNYRNKALKESPQTKAEFLICIKECEVPNIGYWKPGDVVTEPKAVELLKNNYNYFKLDGGKLNG